MSNLDPVDIHDTLSEGFAHIEHVIREEMAKISDILREGIIETNYKWVPYSKYKIPVVPGEIPVPCQTCSNHPSNGGTGICHCTLATPKIT